MFFVILAITGEEGMDFVLVPDMIGMVTLISVRTYLFRLDSTHL